MANKARKQEEVWARRWHAMMERCYNPNHRDWDRYGGRGIRVCIEWHDKARYIAYMQGISGTATPNRSMTVDRIDNDGDYEPSNVRLASPTTQNRNRSCCYSMTAQGETHTVKEWARILGVPAYRLYRRHALGWTDAEIIQGHRDGRAAYGQQQAA